MEGAIPLVVHESRALPADLRSDERLANLLDAISQLADAAEIDGGDVCTHCMGCQSVRPGYRVLPADKVLALRRGETIDVPVFHERRNEPPPYQVGEVIGVLETWGQGYYYEEVFWNDVDGHSCSRLEWVEIIPDPDEGPPAIWYYADGEPPSNDSDYEWDRRQAIELEPAAVRTWFRVVSVGMANFDDWVFRCELAERPVVADEETIEQDKRISPLACPVPGCTGLMYVETCHFVCAVCGARSVPELIAQGIYELAERP
ncbi:MAG: hypothetical protein GTN69_11275 [Armatimonadetes bacterium]|nr:hypothetical protein [Armatimonadota bacterium]